MSFLFFNDPSTTEIYTLSLHDALPISRSRSRPISRCRTRIRQRSCGRSRLQSPSSWQAPPLTLALSPEGRGEDRKSTRLNSSHSQISYAVFCLKKKKKNI